MDAVFLGLSVVLLGLAVGLVMASHAMEAKK